MGITISQAPLHTAQTPERILGDEQCLLAGNFPRELSEQYFKTRIDAMHASRAQGEELLAVQSAVGEWARQNPDLDVARSFTKDEYATPSYDAVMKRFSILAEYVQHNFADQICPEDIEASRLFVESSFAMYNETPTDGGVHDDVDGSFGFVVPTRLSRQSMEYGEEVETIMPILRYLPNDLRIAFAIGLPPCIIDTYSRDEDGKRGYLVLAPIFTDMMDDLDLGDAYEVAINNINKTVDFAYHRLGAKIQGLGAIIPSLTKYGEKITNENVITTTGHGGTVQLIMDTIDRAVGEGYIEESQLKKIGVLGLGAIGRSIAEIVRYNYSDAEIRLYDIREGLVARVAGKIGAVAAQSETEVIRKSEIIISAVTTFIDPKAIGLGRNDVEGKMIVDDSQPCSFDPKAVEKLGGHVAWVIGANGIERSSYDFGGSMANPTNEIFGCEAEAATMAAYYSEIKRDGLSDDQALGEVKKVALRSAVTPDKVKAIARLFSRYNVHAAPIQAFGRYLEKPKQS